MTGNPGFHRKAFGGTTVTALSDGCPNPPNEALPAISPAEAAARGSQPRSGVNALLVPFGGRDVLVDTGAGAKARPTLDRVPDSLAAAGASPGSAARGTACVTSVPTPRRVVNRGALHRNGHRNGPCGETGKRPAPPCTPQRQSGTSSNACGSTGSAPLMRRRHSASTG